MDRKRLSLGYMRCWAHLCNSIITLVLRGHNTSAECFSPTVWRQLLLKHLIMNWWYFSVLMQWEHWTLPCCVMYTITTSFSVWSWHQNPSTLSIRRGVKYRIEQHVHTQRIHLLYFHFVHLLTQTAPSWRTELWAIWKHFSFNPRTGKKALWKNTPLRYSK